MPASLTRDFASWAATALTLFALDMLWLGLVARPLYRTGLGHLMAAAPALVPAALFYLLYPVGVVLFAVSATATGGLLQTLWMGALFGFFAYATYDLTNLATLRDWPVGLAVLDIAWGSAVTAVAALAGRAARAGFPID